MEKKRRTLAENLQLAALSWSIPKAVPSGLAEPSPVSQSVATAALQDDEGTLYLEHLMNKVKGEIDIQGLEKAFQSMIDRHDALRTRYFFDDRGEVRAEVIAPGECKGCLTVVDRREGMDGSETPDDIISSLKKRPVVLSEAPAIRISLVMLPDAVNLILLTASHALVDGTSGPIFLRELCSLYNGIELAPVKYQYSQFAQWQRHHLAAGANKSNSLVKRELDYWSKNLAGAPSLLDLALDYPRPKVFKGHAQTHTVQMDPGLCQKVKRFMESNHQSPWRIFLIAYYFGLRTYSGQEDVVINIPRTTRLPVMADTIGHFANFVPIRIGGDQAKIDSFNMVDASKFIGMVMKDAVRNGDVMFGDIVKRICAQRDPSYTQVSQAVLSIVLQEWVYFPSFQGTESLELPLDVNDNERIMSDLYLRVFVLDDSLVLSMSYNCDIFQKETIGKMMEFIQKSLECCMEHEEARLSDLPIHQNFESNLFWKKSLAGMPAESALLANFRTGTNIQGANNLQNIVFKDLECLQLEESKLSALLLAGVGITLLRFTGETDVLVAVKLHRIASHAITTTFEGLQLIRFRIDNILELALKDLIDDLEHQLQEGSMHAIFSWAQLCHLGGVGRTHDRPSKHISTIATTLFTDDKEISPTSDFPLVLCFQLGCLEIKYDSKILDSIIVSRMCECLTTVISYIQSHSDDLTKTVPLIDQTTAPDDLVSSLLGPICEPRMNALLVHQEFEKKAASNPEDPCLVYEGVTMKYSEVNHRANAVAWALLKRDLKTGDLVGILLERSFDLVIGILGVLKAGGGYVPMDPSYPEDRLTIYAEDSHAAVVLAQAHNLDLASRISSNVMCMHECIPGPHETFENPEVRGIEPESTCLVLFTSGSTGRPKGVQHGHRHLREVIMGTVDYFGLTSEDIILMTNTICFDVHMIQMYPPLVTGGRLVLAKPDGHMDPDYIASKIVQHNVSGLIFTVPFLAKLYVQSPVFDKPYVHMKHWGMGGDAVPLDIVHQMQRIFPSMDGPVDSYGPTEGNVVTQYRFPPGAKCSLIGVPDINVHCGIVDSTMQMLPRGVPGELLLSGPRMALGYYGKPELTAEKFVPNPLFSWIEKRMPESMKDMYKIAYRTGDLVRLRDDGNLEYLGRIDRQVKINGVRIELGEVEGVIRGLQGVQNAVCSAVKRKENEGKVLVAYVVPESVSAAEVIGHCSKELLPSMVPSHVVSMETFPLLPNGKVDVKNLPDPHWKSTEEEFSPAVTDMEGKIEQIWMNVLDRQEPISMTSSFFSIGGDSLLANQVIGQLRRELENQEITVSMLFENTTIRSLACALANILSDNNTAKRWTTLRSTTIKVKPTSSFLSRQNISQNAFLGLLGRSKTIRRQIQENDLTGEHQDKVILSAESTNIAKYASADRKSRMPFIVYLVLQLICSSLIPCVFPSLAVCFCLLTHLALKNFSGILVVFVSPIVYAICMNFGSLAILIILKGILFPKKMAAGVYPLHGSVYLRWIFLRCLQHKVIEYNFRYVRRTQMIVAIYNALGANIRYNVILDSPNIVDPDLITMQGLSTLGEGASVKGSFIVPAGVLGKQAALVLSPSRIGISCDIGLAANVQAGGHIFSGHSLKPYGTLSQSTDVLDTEKMKEIYPHFYPEAFLKPGFVLFATLIQWSVLYLCCLPVSAVCISAARLVMFFMQIPDFSDSVMSLATFIFMEILFIKLVASFCMPKIINAVLIYYKRTLMGPLRPGRNLVTDSLDCLAYCIYRKLMDIPYFNYWATAVPLGLNIDPSTGIKDGISEHDAVTIQARGTSGGKTYFRTVNASGTIMGILIGEEVSCGNSAFFPGCKVGDRSHVGNETAVQCKKVIPMDVQVQADRIIEFGSVIHSSGRKETAPPFSTTSQIAFKKEAPWNIAYWLLVHVPMVSLVPLSASYHYSLVIPGMILSSALHFVANAAWIRMRLLHLRFKDIVKDGESLRNSPECHAAYLQAAFGIFGLSDFLWPIIGTPIYNYILRYIMGLEVHPNAIIHTAIMIEAHLWNIGNAVLDYATMVVPHYMKSGGYWFHAVNVPDGAWIGANCRILVPSNMEGDSRVLPGTTILPRERILRGTVWSGIPGAPVTKHLVKEDMKTD